ncbi:MAG: outer membrane lipoprotein-sorting protein [Bacteriovoracaceae bacterium]
MNRFLKTIVPFFILSYTSSAYTNCDKTGLEVMKIQEKYHQTASEKEFQSITLKDLKSGSTENRDMQRTKKTVNSLSKSLIVFSSPSSIKGTALLSHEQNERGDDQWLYLPALRKTQRIAPSGKKNYFMGTDFTFADLEDEALSQYDYSCKKLSKCGPDKCYLIEATPKNKRIVKDTGYSMRKLWVRNDTYVTVRIKYLDPKGNDLKTLTNSQWKKYGKTAWRPRKAVMKRPGLHQTTVLTKERKVDLPISEEIFQERYLIKGMHLK